MKKNSAILFLGLCSSFLFGQVSIGTTITQKPDVILDVNSSTNKGLLIPRISLKSTDITSKESPVKNPVDGLIIYNYDNTKGSLQGFYIWMDNSWQLLSSNDNKNSNLVISNLQSNTENELPISSVEYVDLETNINSILINTITDAEVSNNIYTLPKGNYSIDLTLNLQSEIPPNTGILDKDIHNISYKLRIIDENNEIVSNEHIVNYTLSAKNNGLHTLFATIDFKLNEKKDIRIQILKDIDNSTHNNIIKYKAGSIQISRGIIK